ncbi:MAG: MATE family efflux transporter [Planctomycetia bacterium]|nr:MATE family efflux transporter [Planctomycetia bacterium]
MNRSLVDTPGTLRPMLRLALPVLVEQLLSLAVIFSDLALTGHFLGQTDMAAMTMLSYIMWLIPSLFALVGIGATALVARFCGAKEFDLARRATHQALLLGAGLMLCVMLVVYFAAEPLLGRLNLSTSALPLAVRYMRLVGLALPAIMLVTVGPACLRGAGDTVSGMLAMGLVNLINIATAWTLVRGSLGAPELGWDGLAFGVLAGYWAGAIVILVLLLRGRAGLRLSWQELTLDRELSGRLLRVGVPGGSDLLSVILCQIWFVSIIFRLGDDAAAAHGVAVRIEALAYLPGYAFQIAAATLTGQYLGAKDPKRAARGVGMALLAGGGLMIAAGLVMLFGAEMLVHLFVKGDKVDVIALAAPLLRIVSFSMPALALLSILSGALRGAGDTRWPFLITLVGLVGVRIPLAYLFTGHYELGVQGAWYAMVIDLVVRATLITARFKSGVWKHIRV